MVSDDVVKEISAASGKTEDEIKELIKRKQAFFENLISEEGAAQIVAADLGAKLEKKPVTFKPMKINDIKQKMSSVNIICKVVRIFETRQFKTEKAEGSVGNIILGDETSSIKMVLWNEQLTQVLEQIKEGDVLKIFNAYARENNKGGIELHVGNTTKIEIAEDVQLDVKDATFSSTPVIPIRMLKEGYGRIKASVIQKFEPNYYKADPETGKKVAEGTPNAVNRAILNLVVDDGTGSLRITMFGEKADEFLKQADVLGLTFYFEGKAAYNEQFDRVDFIANKWELASKLPSAGATEPLQAEQNATIDEPAQSEATDEDIIEDDDE